MRTSMLTAPVRSHIICLFPIATLSHFEVASSDCLRSVYHKVNYILVPLSLLYLSEYEASIL